jgi:hypothetical protein
MTLRFTLDIASGRYAPTSTVAALRNRVLAAGTAAAITPRQIQGGRLDQLPYALQMKGKYEFRQLGRLRDDASGASCQMFPGTTVRRGHSEMASPRADDVEGGSI